MKIQTLLAYAIVALTTVILTKAADNTHLTATRPVGYFDFDRLAKMDGPEMEKALGPIHHEEEEMEAEVNRELMDTQRKEARIAAVQIAGLYRFASSARIIAKMIDFQGNIYPGTVGITGSPPDLVPCGQSLFEIGDASILPILQNIATSNDQAIRDKSMGA